MSRSLLDIGDRRTAEGKAILQERYAALQQQIPLLYLLVSVNYLGLNIGMSGELVPRPGPTSLIFALVLARLLYWYKHRNRRLCAEQIYRELRVTLMLTALISASLCCWSLFLFERVDTDRQHLVIFFATVTGLGCAYGLSSFPTAARLPLIVVAAPLSVRLLFSNDPILTTLGVSIALASFLTLRMLGAHHQTFEHLVQSRMTQEAEQRRARLAEAEARTIADTDPLTGIANRRAFLRALSEAHASLTMNSVGVAMVDLDGFKPINDTFGHAVGDAMLKEAGRRLQQIAGPGGVVARMGGDEFAVLHQSIVSEQQAEDFGRSICRVLGASMQIGSNDLRISGSCGISFSIRGQVDPMAQIAEGDSALYVAKQKGPSRWAVFDPGIQEQVRRRSRIEQMLREPAIDSQLRLVLQPIFDLKTMEVLAFEALARLRHPQMGDIPPDEFIRLAEQMNIIDNLTYTLLTNAVRQGLTWPSRVKLSFNISGRQISSPGAANRLLSIIRNEGFPTQRLQIEVTETAFLGDFEAARENVANFRAQGIKVTLDDFGAGHASLSYLREVQFDSIKLDGRLLLNATTCDSSYRLLRGIVDLCGSIGIPCIAEHIEDPSQLNLLREIGCPAGQGYLLSRPLDPEQARLFASQGGAEIISFRKAASRGLMAQRSAS